MSSGQCLREKRSVWIDATFADEVKHPNWEEPYSELARRTGSRLILLRCVAPEAVIMQRLKDRDDSIDYEKLADWERFMEEEPIRTPHGGIEIDTTRPIKENKEYILYRMRA